MSAAQSFTQAEILNRAVAQEKICQAEVTGRFMQQDTPIYDHLRCRWIQCARCGGIKKDRAILRLRRQKPRKQRNLQSLYEKKGHNYDVRMRCWLITEHVGIPAGMRRRKTACQIEPAIYIVLRMCQYA